MSDLIKFLRTSTSSAYNKVAADRIEQLNERLTAATDDANEAEAYAQELKERNKELTLQLLATSGQAADALDKLTKAEEERDGYLAERNKFQLYLQRTHADLELEVAAVEALNAKLAKTVEALRNILSGDDMYPWRIAREVLVELEGK